MQTNIDHRDPVEWFLGWKFAKVLTDKNTLFLCGVIKYLYIMLNIRNILMHIYRYICIIQTLNIKYNNGTYVMTTLFSA